MSNLIISAVNVGEFCTKASEVLQFAGWALTFFKVAIPILIVVLGMLDFGKAVVAKEDDEIKKQTKKLVYRAVAGIIIFFIPSIVLWLFSVVGDYSEAQEKAEFDVCSKCILVPWGTECKQAVESE